MLWGQRGVVNQFFQPLELWQAQCAGRMTRHTTLPAGHFIPEEFPREKATVPKAFFCTLAPSGWAEGCVESVGLIPHHAKHCGTKCLPTRLRGRLSVKLFLAR
jgi:hypothetical protein